VKILVTGDREWSDTRRIVEVLVEYHSSDNPPTLIHGACCGADTLAKMVGKALGWNVIPFPADWDKYNLAAGPIRNQVMVDQKPDIVIAFHNNLAKSRGTKNCVSKAIKAGIEIVYVKSKDDYETN